MSVAETTVADERLIRRSLARTLLSRPEFGALIGTIVVWIVFAFYAGSVFIGLDGVRNYTAVAADIGILAVAVALLMIAGEFDLSIGSVIAATGMLTALISIQLQQNVWVAIAVSGAFAVLIGLFNGWLVVRTGLPSFIVTLGMMFALAGLTIGVTRLVTSRTQLGGLEDMPGYESARVVFGSEVWGFNVTVLWWIAFVVIGTYVLTRTRFGNWTFGTGGNLDGARNLGVPVSRVRISLFVVTALSAWFVAITQLVTFKGTDVLRGTGKEFEAIIAAVIGGCLLTGGYGSVIGAALGALLFGIVKQGIIFAQIDSDWYKFFLGVMLVLAVLINNWFRRRLLGGRG
ncbi:MAG: ABC transporter permease [Actinomycetales bacterium]